MTKPHILYLFRNNVSEDLKSCSRGQLPMDYYYYYHDLKKNTDITINSLYFKFKTPQLLNRVADYFLPAIYGINFSIVPAFFSLHHMKRNTIIFATTHKLGIGAAFFKMLRITNSPLVLSTCGLYDLLLSIKNPVYTQRIVAMLHHVDLFVSGSSMYECKKLAAFLNIPLHRFKFTSYGIDTAFFKPTKCNKEYILGIGVDPTRDWILYKKIAKHFPKEKFLLATHKKNIPFNMPANVTIQYVETDKLVKVISKAKAALVLSKPNHHFAGQSTAMRIMACARPVILTQTPGTEEFKYRHNNECLYVKPGDTKTVNKYLQKLINEPTFGDQIGLRSRKIIQKYYSYEKIGSSYQKIFQKFNDTLARDNV